MKFFLNRNFLTIFLPIISVYLFFIYFFATEYNILGPDYDSYIAALSNGFQFWMQRELISWLIIEFFSESYSKLLILSVFILFLLSVSIFLILSSIFFNDDKKIKDQKHLILFGSLYCVFSPFLLLLSFSALRQGIGSIFFMIFLFLIYNNKKLASAILLTLAALSHNSFIVYGALYILISIYFRFFSSVLLPYLFLPASIFIADMLVPKADLVTSSNLILYLGLQLLVFILSMQKKNYPQIITKLTMLSIIVPVTFILDLSYFDRFSLFSSLILLMLFVYYSSTVMVLDRYYKTHLLAGLLMIFLVMSWVFLRFESFTSI